MPRKNTAEAFEVLYRIAEERNKTKRAAREQPAATGGEEVVILPPGAPAAREDALAPGLPRVWGKEQFSLVRVPREPLLRRPSSDRRSLATLWGLPPRRPFAPAESSPGPAFVKGRGSVPGEWMAASLRGSAGPRPRFGPDRGRSRDPAPSSPWTEAEGESSSGPVAPWKLEEQGRSWAGRAPSIGDGAARRSASGSLDPLASSEPSARHERWIEAADRAALLAGSVPQCAACGAPCHAGAAPRREALESAETGPPEEAGGPQEISCLEAREAPPERRRRRQSPPAAGGQPAAGHPARTASPDVRKPLAEEASPAETSFAGGEGAESSAEPPAGAALPAPPRQCPAPAPAAVPAGAAPPGAIPRFRGKLAEWVLGGSLSARLERRIEVKFSTILGFAMAAVTTVFVTLIYLRTPAQVDPRFALLDPPVEAGAGRSLDASALAESAPLRPVEARLLPIWSPSSAPLPPPGAPEGRPGEVRGVETTGEGPEPAPGSTGAPPPRRASEAPPSPYVYLIQVRAKESAEGAQRIIEYLREFGFQESLVQVDPRGDRNAEGQLLHTVFVGKYHDKDEADREADRLKRETRLRPYKGKETFFRDALVITRRR